MRRFIFLVLGGMIMAGSAGSPTSQPVAAQVSEHQDDLRSLSTRFDSPQALQDWQELRVEGWAPKWEPPAVENDSLVLRPRSSGWFEDNTAGHLYRQVTGDFIVTTHIRVEGTQNTMPQRSFSLAVLFSRPSTPRFPLATLDPIVSFNPQLSETRLRELMND